MKRKQCVNLDIVLYIKPTSFRLLCSQFHALSFFRKILDSFCALLTLVRNLFRPCSFFVRTFSHLARFPSNSLYSFAFFDVENRGRSKRRHSFVFQITLLKRNELQYGFWDTTRYSSWYYTKIVKAWTNSCCVTNYFVKHLEIPLRFISLLSVHWHPRKSLTSGV